LEQHLDGARWEKIVTPAEGVPLKPSGVIIARTEAERFEREHGIFGTKQQRMINNRRKPARVRSASPAHRPATTGMPSLAPSYGGFTMKACLRARAN
jgi:hypothetical protein